MKADRIFYKEATPHSLNEILLQSPYITEHYKLIPRIWRTLNRVLAKNNRDDGKSDITRLFFKDRFGDEYPSIVRALETSGLLINDHVWIAKSAEFKGKCFSYLLTDKCCTALADTNKEYLYKLLQDRPTIRRNQKQVSGRGYNGKVYGDIRDYHKRVIDEMTYNICEIDKVADTYRPAKKAFVYSLLVDIVRKDYGELHRNAKDGRIWTPYAQLPAEIKKLIKVDGLDYQMTMDIRSCYPSLWAEYVCSFVKGHNDPQQYERKKWNDLFLNKDIDPKAVITNAIGVSRDAIKEVMIQYFNSKIRGKAFRAFDAWISREFPNLYTAWKATNIKQTGNNIGKYFETKLMLDESIYNKADELGIVIGYEYDGMSFYAKDDTNCQTLLDYIEQRSFELLGIKLVFVNKVNGILSFMASGEIDILSKEIGEIDASLNALRKRCWRSSQQWKKFNDIRYKGTDAYWRYGQTWKPYYELRERRDALLNRASEINAMTE
jgi:hypothetical protein